MDNSEGTWRISKPIGGRMSKTRPLFSIDNETLWVPSGNLVCCFSVRTGLLQSSYAHKSAVLCLDYLESQQKVMSVCRGGMIVQRSVGQKKSVVSLELGKSIWRVAYSNYTGAHYYVSEKEGNHFVGVFKVNDGAIEELPIILLPDASGACRQLIISPSGKVLSLVIGKTVLYCRLDSKPFTFMKLDHEVPLISTTISPNDSTIVAGDIVGKICHWNIVDSARTKSTFHWHSHTVECVLFNSDGSMIYSGGHEGVLVLWHVNANTKTFLPRFSSQLATLGISKDGTHLAVGLANNSVKIVNTATLKEVQTISQLHFDPATFTAAQDPLRKQLAISSNNGTVQFYDVPSKRVIETLDISFKNYASKTFNEVVNPLVITELVFSSAGDFLLSVEQTTNEKSTSLVKYEMSVIKFWKRSATGAMTLSAIIENPHRGKRITHAIASHYEGNTSFITAGEDARFMVWEYVKSEDKQTWACTITGSYKDMKIHQIRFIPNRLCILYEKNLVTLWDPKNMYTLVEAYCVPLKEELISCEFSTDGLFMLGLTKKALASFALSNKTLLWELKVSAFQLYNDPSSDAQCCVLLNPLESDKKTSAVLFLGYENSTPLTICRFKSGSSIVKAIYADLKYKQNSVVVFKNNGQMQKISYVQKDEKMTDETVKEHKNGAVVQTVVEIGAAMKSVDGLSHVSVSLEDILREQIKHFNIYLDNFRSFDSISSAGLYQNTLNAVLVKKAKEEEPALAEHIGATEKNERKAALEKTEHMEIDNIGTGEVQLAEDVLSNIAVSL